jgi:hypothetical protein
MIIDIRFVVRLKTGGVLLYVAIEGPVLLSKVPLKMRGTSLKRNCRQMSPVKKFLKINKPISGWRKTQQIK